MTSKLKMNEAGMRSAFEAWAQQQGSLVRRREDKPDLYLISETQRHWLIWREAYCQGLTARPAASNGASAGLMLQQVS